MAAWITLVSGVSAAPLPATSSAGDSASLVPLRPGAAQRAEAEAQKPRFGHRTGGSGQRETDAPLCPGPASAPAETGLSPARLHPGH